LVSVIVAVRDGSATLAACLEAIARSTRLPDECIVVDDASTDESAAIASQSGVQLLRMESQRGPACARNAGARAAHGDVLLFLDADVCVHPDTIGRIAAHFETGERPDAVFGSYDDAPHAAGLVSQYRNLLHAFTHQSAPPEAHTFWCGCGAIRRDRFFALGGLAASYTRPSIEDVDLGYRLKDAGGRILLDRNAQVTHWKRWTLSNMCRTDIFQRAVPWTRLILETRLVPNHLNLRFSQRGSVLAAALLPLAGVAAVLDLTSELWMVPLLIMLAAGNWRFFQFLHASRGWGFTALAVPLHMIHHFCCAAGFALGTGAHLGSRLFSPRTALGPRPAEEG
jgi:glycosyltransferase involved in cell wall biosynthesis